MEYITEHETGTFNFTVPTEVITELVMNFTEPISWSETTILPNASVTSFMSLVSDAPGISSAGSTPAVPSNCTPGYPAIRQVCHDHIFNLYVWTFFVVIFGVIIVAAVAMNSLVLLVMARSRRARRLSHNVYTTSLAFSDLMVVLVESPFIYAQFLLPGHVSARLFNRETHGLCLIFYFCNCLFGTASVMTQLALNVDRYCMISHPLTTRALAKPTKTRAGFILILVWSVAMIPQFGNMFLFGEVRNESYQLTNHVDTYEAHFCMSVKSTNVHPSAPHVYTATVFCIFYLSALMSTLGLYVKIVFTLRDTKSTSTSEVLVNSTYSTRDSNGLKRRNHRWRATRNILRIMGCSVVSYSCCYSIYFYVNFYYIYFGLLRNNGFTLVVVANIMGALNALVNPVLFACFHDEFKRFFLSKRWMMCARETHGTDQTTSNFSSGSENNC